MKSQEQKPINIDFFDVFYLIENILLIAFTKIPITHINIQSRYIYCQKCSNVSIQSPNTNQSYYLIYISRYQINSHILFPSRTRAADTVGVKMLNTWLNSQSTIGIVAILWKNLTKQKLKIIKHLHTTDLCHLIRLQINHNYSRTQHCPAIGKPCITAAMDTHISRKPQILLKLTK